MLDEAGSERVVRGTVEMVNEKSRGARGLRVLLLEGIHTSAVELLREAGCEVELSPGALSESGLIERLAKVDVLGIRSKTRVTERVLEAAPGLLSVGCFCIGTNQVALAQANRRGVPVFNAPFSNTRSVAEMVLAEVVMLARRLGDNVREMHRGEWNKLARGCFEVRGKTLGIIGYGHIGAQVGVLAESFGMRVVFHDIATKLPMGNVRSVGSLAELLDQADFVTLHVPATEQTRGMIGRSEIMAMKPGAYLINASRGTVVDIAALAEALKSEKLAGAAVDVFPEEPEKNGESFESELVGLRNVVLTPHIGGSTEEAQESIGREVATSLVRYMNLGATTGAVNFPNAELPASVGKHRILNVHRNVPGVLRDVNKIVSDLDANIHAQVLATDPSIGYLIMDLDQDVSDSVCAAMQALPTDLRTRIVD